MAIIRSDTLDICKQGRATRGSAHALPLPTPHGTRTNTRCSAQTRSGRVRKCALHLAPSPRGRPRPSVAQGWLPSFAPNLGRPVHQCPGGHAVSYAPGAMQGALTKHATHQAPRENPCFSIHCKNVAKRAAKHTTAKGAEFTRVHLPSRHLRPRPRCARRSEREGAAQRAARRGCHAAPRRACHAACAAETPTRNAAARVHAAQPWLPLLRARRPRTSLRDLRARRANAS